VFAAELINNLGRESWETFAGQNYFDSRGLFITVVLSTPLLITALFILVNILLIMVAMMIEIARRRRETGVKKNQ
jgi:ABC-type antimicrobial peptide transport system permease subunit